MLKIILIAAALFVMPMQGHADSFTIRGFGGHNIISSGFHPLGRVRIKDGQLLGAAIGLAHTPYLRTEIECSYRYNEISQIEWMVGSEWAITPLKTRLESLSVMTNFISSVPVESFLRPFFGIGIGGSRVWHQINKWGGHGLTYQFITGFHIPPTEQYYCGLEFRFLHSIVQNMAYNSRSYVFTCHKIF